MTKMLTTLVELPDKFRYTKFNHKLYTTDFKELSVNLFRLFKISVDWKIAIVNHTIPPH